jgi:hypothetical protein
MMRSSLFRAGVVATGVSTGSIFHAEGRDMKTAQQISDCKLAAASIATIKEKKNIKVVAGFDGFVDNIIDVVDKRTSHSEYAAIPTISALGQRISAASNDGCNLELVVKKSKIGGNGPIMCNASCGYGINLTYIGLLGAEGKADEVFTPMVERSEEVISLGPPGITDALEFQDGKIMLGKHESLHIVNYGTLKQVIGVPRLIQLFKESQAVVCINWTMCMGLTGIWKGLMEDVLPNLGGKRPIFFVDIADPAKRTRKDLKEMCLALKDLQRYVDVVSARLS